MTKNVARIIVLLAAILPAAKAGNPPIAVTTCETVISTPGSYFLDNDLDCGNDAFGVAIIADNVDFDLKDHFIFDNGGAFTGTGIGTGVPPFTPSSGCVGVSGLHIHGIQGNAVAGFKVGIAICSPAGKEVSSNNLVEHVGLVDNFTGVSIYGSATKNRVEFSSISKNLTELADGSMDECPDVR